jgi:hypothetical protein
MTTQRTLDEVWAEALEMIELYYPGYELQFRQLQPVAYREGELVLASDFPHVVRLFNHPNWWLGVGDHLGFIFGTGGRMKFTVVSTDNLASVR